MPKIPDAHISGLFSGDVDFFKLLDDVPTPIVVLDAQRRIVSLNQAMATLSGYSSAEARGVPCCHILRLQSCFDQCPLSESSDQQMPVTINTDMINRTREKRKVRVTLSLLKNPAGELLGYLETVEDLRQADRNDDPLARADGFSAIIGNSPAMQKVFQVLPMLAQSDATLLITGETGTGKDLLAESVHQVSERRQGPFIKVNCGALPETLLESELFGHKKGAFTGAVENKPGRFRLAHNGSLFLTEIGDLPMSLQVKLLTFLDDHMVYPLGSTQGFQANVRMIAATHRNLEQMVADGTFRQDLLFRLNVARVQLPPLRERIDDIRLMLDHFREMISGHLNKSVPGFSGPAMAHLLNYPFPGNVRELRNIVEYAVNICPQAMDIELSHLPVYIMASAPVVSGSDHVQVTPVPAPTRAVAGSTWPETERQMIMDALVQAGGTRTRAAEILGWGRSTLWRKMRQYGIDA